MRKIKIILYRLWYTVYCLCHKEPNVVRTDDTLNKLIEDDCSISRFGDGEFSLMLGKSLPFQKYSKKLKEKLKEVLESETERHLVAIPNVFGSLEEFSEKSKAWWKDYLLGNRKKIYSLLPKNRTFYDAQITRIYINRKDKNQSKERFEKIKTLWSKKNILIVEGELSRFGVGNDLFDDCKSVRRILVPSKNAFEKYQKIYESTLRMSEKYAIDLILLAIGPTATCLAFDLHNAGKRTLDLGNLDMEYEWMNQRAESQIAIDGKYTHEAKDGDKNIGDIFDKKYESQIVDRVE